MKRMNRAKAVAKWGGEGKKWRSAGIIRLSYRATCWPFPFAKGKKKEKNRKGGNNN